MQFNPEKTIFLIDASNFLYRSYYGLPPLNTKNGEPVQAVYSFCRTLKKIIDTYQPQQLALIWDSKGKTKRHELYAEYKATRQAAPSDLFSQKERIKEFATIIGITQIEQQGVEADDIIATLSRRFEQEGYTVVILSSDKDLGQLLSNTVFLLDVFKDKIIDKEAFEKTVGFPVSHLPVFYGLLGDASDNIPGVSGVGKKSAEQLAKQYASMKELYEHLHNITPTRVQSSLKQDRENAFLSEQLFMLETIPLKIKKEDLAFHKESWQKAAEFFQMLDFTTLLKDLFSSPTQTGSSIEDKKAFWKTKNLLCVTTKDQLDSVCNQLTSASYFAFDTETTGLDPLNTSLVGISVSYQKDSAFYIPFGHIVQEKQLDQNTVLSKLTPFLQDTQKGKIAHNAKYDFLVLSQYDITVQGLILDTFIAGQLVFEESVRSGLKSIVSYVFHEEMLTFDDIVKNKKLANFSEVSLDDATLYAANDAYQTFYLKEEVETRLQKQKQLSVYQEIEHPLIEVLVAMEKQGIFCDTKILSVLSKQVIEELGKIEKEIFSYTDQKEINLNSPQQIRVLLFETLKLPPQKKSASGGYSTDIEVLEALKTLHPIPGLLIQHRELSKLKNTYIDALPTFINPKDNKIHTTFLQLKTATGRLASNSPNLQNIPADVEKVGGKIREAFIPDPGYLFLSADYSQIELRILAYLSQDQALIAAFLQNHDIHAETASRLFDVALDKVTHEQRQIGKRINFSILYGLTPFGLSKDLGIPFQDAKTYIKKYFEQYPGVSVWMENVITFATQHGFVETFWGRRRMTPNIHQKNKTLYEEARRVAINTVAQGTAADLVKKGMIAIHNWARKESNNTQIVLQIHDELLISFPENETENVTRSVQKILESIVSWNIPLKVSVRTGKNWKEVTK